MADIQADVVWGVELTEADILAGGIKPGQQCRASDTGVEWFRSVDGLSYHTAKNGNEYPYADTLDPTGFVYTDIDVSYNPTTRRVTLSDNGAHAVKLLWRGVEVPAFVNGWTSDAHSEPVGAQVFFLRYNGTSAVWGSTPWEFTDAPIALVYRDGANFCIREVHGCNMSAASHREAHNTIGTYLDPNVAGGFDGSSYVLDSTLTADRRPELFSHKLWDEDVPTTNAALTTNDYTWLELTGADSAVITVDNADIIAAGAGGRFEYNLFTGGAWTDAQSANGDFGKIFVISIPVTSDAECQKARYVFIKPQAVYATLSLVRGVSPSDIQFGSIAGALQEYVFIGEIIVKATSSSWKLVEVNELRGSRLSQVSRPASTTPNIDQVLTAGNVSDKGIEVPYYAIPMTTTANRLCKTDGQTVASGEGALVAGIGTGTALVTDGVTTLEVINRTGGSMTFTVGQFVYRDDTAYSYGKVISNSTSPSYAPTSTAPFVGVIAETLGVATANGSTAIVRVQYMGQKYQGTLASATTEGLMGTGSQTIAGAKTFQDGLTDPKTTLTTTQEQALDTSTAGKALASYAGVLENIIGVWAKGSAPSFSGDFIQSVSVAQFPSGGLVTSSIDVMTVDNTSPTAIKFVSFEYALILGRYGSPTAQYVKNTGIVTYQTPSGGSIATHVLDNLKSAGITESTITFALNDDKSKMICTLTYNSPFTINGILRIQGQSAYRLTIPKTITGA